MELNQLNCETNLRIIIHFYLILLIFNSLSLELMRLMWFFINIYQKAPCLNQFNVPHRQI